MTNATGKEAALSGPVAPQAASGGSSASQRGGRGGSVAPSPPSLDEAVAWVGMRLDDIRGTKTGSIEAVYVDAGSGHPVWLQARMGRFGHRTLVPLEHAVGAGKRVWVAHERDAIRAAPRVDPGHELDAQAELDLLGHYGFPASSGRSAELQGRDGTTTRPA